MSLASDVSPNEFTGHVNRVYTVRQSTQEWEFPLRAEYVRVNRSIEGINEQAKSDAERKADLEIAEMQRAREGFSSLPPVSRPSTEEEVRPPRPTGPDDYVFHNGKWCLPRGGDGRLMPVDESGTFVRKRTVQGDLARPVGVPKPMWDMLSRSKKLEELRRVKASGGPVPAGSGGAASSSAMVAKQYSTFTVTLLARSSSTWPPWEAPLPVVVVWRIVVDAVTGESSFRTRIPLGGTKPIGTHHLKRRSALVR